MQGISIAGHVGELERYRRVIERMGSSQQHFSLPQAKSSLETGREEVWEEIPRVFGFDEWDALIRNDKVL